MEESKIKTSLQFLNIVAFVGTVVVNILANTLPIAGKTTGELSDLYPNLFVPAGFTFAIWGVIYILLALFVIYQALDILKLNKNPVVEKIGVWFILASLANMAWIFAWHYEQVFLSLLVMLVLLISLLRIYLRLGIGVSKVSKDEKYFVHLPFSVYLGWITVATVANVTAFLVDINWGRFGLSEVTWTVVVIVVATLITLKMLQKHGDIFYSLVVIWAFVGILAKRLSADLTHYFIVVVLLAALAVITYYTIIKARLKFVK